LSGTVQRQVSVDGRIGGFSFGHFGAAAEIAVAHAEIRLLSLPAAVLRMAVKNIRQNVDVFLASAVIAGTAHAKTPVWLRQNCAAEHAAPGVALRHQRISYSLGFGFGVRRIWAGRRHAKGRIGFANIIWAIENGSGRNK
jgi:hypothetical protein